MAPGATVFASWGKSFRAPAVIENACADPEAPCPLPFALGDDPPLDPVKVSTIEGGFRYATASLALDGSVYHTDVQNDIFLTPYRRRGAERQHHRRVLHQPRQDPPRRASSWARRIASPQVTRLYLNYAFTRATFQSEADIFSIRGVTEEEEEPEAEEEIENPFPTENEVEARHAVPAGSRSHHQGRGARPDRPVCLCWRRRPLHRQAVAARRRGERHVQLDDYVVIDARVGVEFDRWEISGVVTNLFQNRYAIFGTFNINQGNPDGPTVERFLSPGRSGCSG